MKPFIVPEMTIIDHSKSSTVLCFVRLPGLSTRDYTCLHTRIAEMALEGRSFSLAMVQFNRLHIAFY